MKYWRKFEDAHKNNGIRFVIRKMSPMQMTHLSTGTTPGKMTFREGLLSTFPRISESERMSKVIV